MNVFLTGKTGFLGTKFYNLAKSRFKIYFLCRRKKDITDKYCIYGNLDDKLPILSECDLLIHFAAHGVTPNKCTQKKADEINVKKAMRLLRHAANLGVKKFLIIGSSQEYGNLEKLDSKISVKTPLKPNNNYARSKVRAYKKIKHFCESRKLYVTYLRVFNTYGSGQNNKSLWALIEKSLKTNKTIKLRNPNKSFDIQSANKTVKEILKYTDFKNSKRGTLKVKNVGSGKLIKVKDFVRESMKKNFIN